MIDEQELSTSPIPFDTQTRHADGEPSDDHDRSDTHSTPVVGTERQSDPKHQPASNAAAGLADALLLIHADALDDLERVRIATENRVRSLEQMKGLEGSPEAARLTGMVDAINDLEHQATLQLKRVLRKHPLGAWVKRTIGVGEKQGGRLLAAIGDPYWHSQQDRPRTVSELWAYCGYHVVSPTGHGSTANTQNQSAGGGSSSAVDDHSGSAAQSGSVVNGTPASHTRSETHTGVAGGGSSAASAKAVASTQNEAADAVGGSDQIGTVTQSAGVGATTSSSDPDYGRNETHATTVGVAPFRRRGVKSNWNSAAKMRAFLVAESCIKKTASPYRPIYDAGREKYADAVHAVECKRCGPSGKPAAAGSALSAGHQHARAMRLVAKAILKDLWIEAKALHEERENVEVHLPE